ncbi:hypothetical protein FALCPG4_009208 [Fusarium falciforme]
MLCDGEQQQRTLMTSIAFRQDFPTRHVRLEGSATCQLPGITSDGLCDDFFLLCRFLLCAHHGLRGDASSDVAAQETHEGGGHCFDSPQLTMAVYPFSPMFTSRWLKTTTSWIGFFKAGWTE